MVQQENTKGRELACLKICHRLDDSAKSVTVSAKGMISNSLWATVPESHRPHCKEFLPNMGCNLSSHI